MPGGLSGDYVNHLLLLLMQFKGVDAIITFLWLLGEANLSEIKNIERETETESKSESLHS